MLNTTTPPDISASIASGSMVSFQQASSILGLGYQIARRRIYREGLETYRIRGRCYVRVSDLHDPRLRVV